MNGKPFLFMVEKKALSSVGTEHPGSRVGRVVGSNPSSPTKASHEGEAFFVHCRKRRLAQLVQSIPAHESGGSLVRIHHRPQKASHEREAFFVHCRKRRLAQLVQSLPAHEPGGSLVRIHHRPQDEEAFVNFLRGLFYWAHFSVGTAYHLLAKSPGLDAISGLSPKSARWKRI
jgi:uncharacterized short protein YbdD (DUF466 family)